jgi:hypothetical protein
LNGAIYVCIAVVLARVSGRNGEKQSFVYDLTTTSATRPKNFSEKNEGKKTGPGGGGGRINKLMMCIDG